MALVLVLPSPGVTPGITAAGQINTALTSIQNTFNAHDHTGGNGVPIGVAGISIDGDLSFESLGQDYKATDAQAFGFKNQSVSPAGGLMLFIKDPGGAVPPNIPADLWFNNGVVEIQLTSGGGALPSDDGFTQDYNNTVLTLGKAAYQQGLQRYKFTTGDGADAIASSLASGMFSKVETEIVESQVTVGFSGDLDLIANSGLLTLNFGGVGQKVLVTPVGGTGIEGKLEVLSDSGLGGQLIIETTSKAIGAPLRPFSGGRIYGTDPLANPRYLEIGHVDWVGPTPPAPNAGNSRIIMASHQINLYTCDPLFPDAQVMLGPISIHSSADIIITHGDNVGVNNSLISLSSTYKTLGPNYHNTEVKISDSGDMAGVATSKLQLVARRAVGPVNPTAELASAQAMIIGDSSLFGSLTPVDPPSPGACPSINLAAAAIQVTSNPGSITMLAQDSFLAMANAGTWAGGASAVTSLLVAGTDLTLSDTAAGGITGVSKHISGRIDVTGLIFECVDRRYNTNYTSVGITHPQVGTFEIQSQITAGGPPPNMIAFTHLHVLGHNDWDLYKAAPTTHQVQANTYVDNLATGETSMNHSIDTIASYQKASFEWTVSRVPFLKLSFDSAAVAPVPQHSIITKRDIMPDVPGWRIGQGLANYVYEGVSAGYSYNSVGAANIPAAMVGLVGTETEIPSTVEDVFCRHGNNAVTAHCQMYAIGLAVTAAPNSPHWNVLSFIHAAPLGFEPDMPSNWQSTWGEYIIYFDEPLHEATTIQVSPAHNAATTPGVGLVGFEVYLPDVKMSATGNYCFVKWWRLDYTSATGNVGPGAGIVAPLITQEQPNSFHFNTIGSTPTPGVL